MRDGAPIGMDRQRPTSAGCAAEKQALQPEEIIVEVAGNGVGMAADDLSNPQTSLLRLRARLLEHSGDITHSPNETGGITATAYWRANRGLGVISG